MRSVSGQRAHDRAHHRARDRAYSRHPALFGGGPEQVPTACLVPSAKLSLMKNCFQKNKESFESNVESIRFT